MSVYEEQVAIGNVSEALRIANNEGQAGARIKCIAMIFLAVSGITVCVARSLLCIIVLKSNHDHRICRAGTSADTMEHVVR